MIFGKMCDETMEREVQRLILSREIQRVLS